MRYYYIILSNIVILFIFLFFILKKKEKETTKIFQFNQTFDNYYNSDTIISQFLKLLNGIPVKSFYEANIILFSDYTLIDQNLYKIKFNKNKHYYVYGMSGSDEMADKIKLSLYMPKNTIPKSYILSNDIDLDNLIKDNLNLYILKKNIQRQEGIIITNNIKFIIDNKNNYVVAQELLQNPLLVNGRKINMRVYLLIIIKNNNINFYIYNNGFIYYSLEKWKKNSISKEVNITTGYIDRKIYEENPLTHEDLYNFLGDSNSIKLKQSILNLFKTVKESYKTKLISENKLNNITYFNIFGCDIAPDNDLNVKLIEINKGPDLSYKDKRDENVKYNLLKDCIDIVYVGNLYNKNYINII